MSYYTTGEAAKCCGVTVRAVQYYDKEDILKPSTLSEGGRRMYSDEDIKRLQEICMMRSLGVSLSAIKEVLHSENGYEVFRLLLEEQERVVSGEMEKLSQQKERMTAVKEAIDREHWMPVKSTDDIERLMEGKKRLKKMYAWMLAGGIICDVMELAGIVHWVRNGSPVLFLVMLPFVIMLTGLLLKYYYQNVAYICPECHERFKPRPGNWFFAYHTAKLRKVTCTRCGYRGLCVETYSADKTDIAIE